MSQNPSLSSANSNATAAVDQCKDLPPEEYLPPSSGEWKGKGQQVVDVVGDGIAPTPAVEGAIVAVQGVPLASFALAVPKVSAPMLSPRVILAAKANWGLGIPESWGNQPFCCYAWCCPRCAVFSQRQLMMHGGLDENSYCAGVWGRPGDQSCDSSYAWEWFRVAAESCCCYPCAVYRNRRLLREHLQIENSCLDTWAERTMLVCCVVSVFSGALSSACLYSGVVVAGAHSVVQCTAGLLLSQQEREMETRRIQLPVAQTMN